jgi:hypothetical protein
LLQQIQNDGGLLDGKAISSSHEESADYLGSKNARSPISNKLYLLSNVFITVLLKQMDERQVNVTEKVTWGWTMWCVDSNGVFDEGFFSIYKRNMQGTQAQANLQELIGDCQANADSELERDPPRVGLPRPPTGPWKGHFTK